jgi:hypothetical protein
LKRKNPASITEVLVRMVEVEKGYHVCHEHEVEWSIKSSPQVDIAIKQAARELEKLERG